MTLSHNVNSPFPSFLAMGPMLDKSYEPMAGYVPRDPRRPGCAHEWDGSVGQVGERQHLCSHCTRWIWEHSITEPRPVSGDNDHGSSL